MSDLNIIKSINEIFNGDYKFVVPLYQRNFAWGNEEIRKLISDIYDAYMKNKDSEYYIGTITFYLSKDEQGNTTYEVVDGQQRLTALTLFTKLLDDNRNAHYLEYDSRPEVTKLLNTLYEKGASEVLNSEIPFRKTGNYYDQLKFLCKDFSFDRNENGENKLITFDMLLNDNDFKSYFFLNVKLVLAEVPSEMNVAQYFLIMNNRGEQLQAHEIVKAKLLGMINSADGKPLTNIRRICAQIWDACSIMNVRVQRSFDSSSRTEWFGENYDCIYSVDEYKKKIEHASKISLENENPEVSEQYSDLDSIWEYSIKDCSQSNKADTSKKTEINEDKKETTQSIIEFSDFLMHVLKLEYNDDEVDIPLKADNLNSVFDNLKKEKINNHISFFAALLRWRIIFDRFIVKPSEDDEAEIKWKLHKPTKRSSKEKITLSFDKGSFDEPYLEEIVKALSMLQVTYSPRDYKNYLQEVLSWFKDEDEAQTIIDSSGKKFLSKLNRYILKCFESLPHDVEPLALIFGSEQTENYYHEGTKTPHLILNFIDYLYYEAAVHYEDSNNIQTLINDTINHMGLNNEEMADFIEKLKKFEFRYRNSIEHHFPQSRASNAGKEARADVEISPVQEIGQTQCDCLGNLYLIGGSGNSSLGSKSPVDKAKDYIHKDVGPNRRIIINTTNKKAWVWNEINAHYQDLLALISHRKEILGVK